MNIQADHYSRLEGIIGTRVGQKKERYQWDAKLGFGYLMLGNNSEFDVQIKSISELGYARITADKEPPFFVNLGAYGKYDVNKDIDVFINTDLKLASNASAYYVGFGASYKFKLERKIPRPKNLLITKDETRQSKEENTDTQTSSSATGFGARSEDEIAIQELTLATLRGPIFINKSDELTPEAKNYIKNLAERIKSYKKSYRSVEIVVEGYAGWDEPDNKNLAVKRARIVAKELSQYGFKVKYKGNPMVKSNNAGEYKKDEFRKVEFKTTLIK
ncbi:MAG: OmpA family protein [Elusimicrobiota bacterium]|nr:OmpA family protein [Elusimicrobiota bacterium]